MKLVSVVIPTIGNLEFLDLSIDSLLSQTESFAEVVLFDNSKQQELRRNSNFGNDSRVRWEQSGQHLDALDSWTNAVACCRNDYVTIFGDDDVALPDFHSSIQSVLERSEFGLLPFDGVDEHGRKDGVVSGLYRDVTPQQLRYSRIVGGIGMVVPGVVFRRDNFFRVGGFQDVGLPNYLYPDELLWLKLSALEANVAVADRVCWHYRRHKGSLGGNLTSVRGFCGRVGPYVQMLRESLVELGVPEADVFPPHFGPQDYINRIHAAWFNRVVTRILKSGSLNPANYLRELWYYIVCEATIGGKAKGLFLLTRSLARRVVQWAVPLSPRRT